MRRHGFTLVECILALLITSMTMVLCGILLHSFEKNDHQIIDESAQWHLFLRELESPTHEFQLMSCGNQRIMLNSPVSTKYYQLIGNDEHLYLTLLQDKGGYLPLFDHVKEFHTNQISSTQVEIKVVTLNGHHFSNVVKFKKFTEKT